MTAHFQCFVTGTDTEVGKTLISSTMLHALVQTGVRAAGMKPVAAGAEVRNGVTRNEDVERLAAAGNVDLPYELMVPYLLREATAPHRAAALEGVQIDTAHIQTCYQSIVEQADAVVIEGVGGFRVPLSDRVDTADLAQAFNVPVVLVVGLRLGCINHALLTADVIKARGLKIAGWVANLIDPQLRHVESNLEALKARLDAPLLGYVPRVPQAAAATVQRFLDFSSLPNWPAKAKA